MKERTGISKIISSKVENYPGNKKVGKNNGDGKDNFKGKHDSQEKTHTKKDEQFRNSISHEGHLPKLEKRRKSATKHKMRDIDKNIVLPKIAVMKNNLIASFAERKNMACSSFDRLIVRTINQLTNKKDKMNTETVDSDLVIDVESMLNVHKEKTVDEIVRGAKIVKAGRRKSKDKPITVNTSDSEEINGVAIEPKVTPKEQSTQCGTNAITYSLSDPTFIDKGWTLLPTLKVLRKMNIYHMRPSHPEFDWFERNKNKGQMNYDTGEKFAVFDDDGHKRWYYRNGNLALDFYDAEESNVQKRYLIYSSGEPDSRGETYPVSVLAMFDYLGNGVIYDHSGNIRLKYNQTEGTVLDSTIGPVSQWKWHTLNDPPIFQSVWIEKQLPKKDPTIYNLSGQYNQQFERPPDEESMLAIEYENSVKERLKRKKYTTFQIRMKAVKINEQFSLRILEQKTIYLFYRDRSTQIKINVGMILDSDKLVDISYNDMETVANTLERFPAVTKSVDDVQVSLRETRAVSVARRRHEARVRPALPAASVDRLASAAARPLRAQLALAAAAAAPSKHHSYTTTYQYCGRTPS